MKIFTGPVIKTKEKTATVEVRRMTAHPVYGKRIRRTKKYQVHDEIGTKVGDMVRFVATKPISKNKKWKIIEIVGDKRKKTKSKPKTKKAKK